MSWWPNSMKSPGVPWPHRTTDSTCRWTQQIAKVWKMLWRRRLRLEYNAAKEALRALTRTAAREWAPNGITVNAICPAAKSKQFYRAMSEHPELEPLADAMNPMGRIGDPYEDIAPVAVSLAADTSRYLTGNTLFVDGGSQINGVAWAPSLPDS